jgi:hypothetical protein
MSTLVERNQVGKKQDLAEAFVNADMKSLPFMSAVRKGPRPINSLLEYPVERFASPSTEGAVDEADVVSFQDPSAGDGILNARIQTWERAARIGGLAISTTEQAGITPRNIKAKKIAKTLIELKRDMETTVLSDNESQVDNGIVGNKTRGLGKWIQSTAQSHYAVDAAYRTPADSINSSTALADYTDATITSVFQSMFDQHGKGDIALDVWAGSTFKRNLGRITFYSRNESNMTQVRRFNQSVGDAVVMGKVDMLETDFGTASVRLSQFINVSGDPTSAASKRLAYVVPEEFVEMRFSDQPNTIDLAKTGRNEKFLVTATAALAVTNPLPLGKFAPGA